MRREILHELERIVGREGLASDPTQLLVYECDALAVFKHKPDAVVFARNTQQVSDVGADAEIVELSGIDGHSHAAIIGGAIRRAGRCEETPLGRAIALPQSGLLLCGVV